ncbi:MAG: glycoside hydrolase [Verrucomicrobiales bacterium]|nr:glycoside hydrolase [Verrucomicrobiales bacterium]
MSIFPFNRRRFLKTATATAVSPAFFSTAAETAGSALTIQSIERTILRRNRNGEEGTTWFHPRACLIPGEEGQKEIFMNLQSIGGSDYFGPVHWMKSGDGGNTWTSPEPIPALGRVPVEGHPGLEAGVCDVVPQYHSPSKTTLCMGHVVFYRGPRFSKKDQLPRYPVYAIRREDGSWSERNILQWDDPRGAFIYTNNCGQRVTLGNGDVMMSFTFGPDSAARMVAGVRCSFDGENLVIREVGPALKNSVGRGLLEPSVTQFRGRFYMTIRAEDSHGYVATSEDGVNYEKQIPWTWDDGSKIGMSTTQQHWLTHSDGLFLVYTREDTANKNVIRWRSPLWVAQVDPEKLTLIRETERPVFPLDGDGIEDPDKVPLMGNFHVTNISPEESIITVGEWLPRGGAKGNLLMARVKWSKPNQMVS